MTTENVISQFNKYLLDKGIEGNKAIVEAAYDVLGGDLTPKAGGVAWWVGQNLTVEQLAAKFIDTAKTQDVANKWATDYENGVTEKTVAEISDLFAKYLTDKEITDKTKIVEAAYDVLGGGLTPKAGGVAWWVGQDLAPEQLAAKFIDTAGTMRKASAWANGFESGVPGEPGEPSSLTEALENLSEANSAVQSVLDEATKAVFLDANPDATEKQIKDHIAANRFDKAELDSQAAGQKAAIAGLQAAVNTANADVLIASTETFDSATAGAGGQGTVTHSTLTAATAAAYLKDAANNGGTALVDKDAYLTNANIEKAVKDAQAAVQNDDAQYLVHATNLGDGSVIAAGAAVQVVYVDSADGAGITEVAADAAGAVAVYKITASGTTTYYSAQGNGTAVANGAAVGANAVDLTGKTLKSAKQLQGELRGIESDIAADIAKNGTNSELLVELRDAIGEYTKAGVVADGTNNFAAILGFIKTALDNAAAAKTDASLTDFAAVHTALDGVTGITNATDVFKFDSSNKALDDILNALAEKIDTRVDLNADKTVAQTALDSTNSGKLLDAANVLLEARQGLEKAVSDAEEALEDKGALAETLEALQAELKEAQKALDAAEKYFDDEDMEVAIIDNDTFTATSKSDVMLFDVTVEDNEATILNFASDDILFVGKGFTVSTLEAGVKIDEERVGDANVLEMFIQQKGGSTVLYFEQEAFAGSAKSGDDIVTITLTGVDAADVSLSDDGYITIA